MTSSRIDNSELTALRKLSAALGADPLRTQGAGGNTSIKRDGVMWIKASGTWLADALAQDIMTPVRLDPLRKATAADPKNAQAFYKRANAWRARQEYERALKDYEEVIRLDPKSSRSYDALAWLKGTEGRWSVRPLRPRSTAPAILRSWRRRASSCRSRRPEQASVRLR